MKILLWLIVAGFQKIFVGCNVFDWAMPVGAACHNFALGLLEHHPTSWTWFYEAILIGRDEGLRSQPALQSFFTLGLYHLIVVSGSHVLALEKILKVGFFYLTKKQQKFLTFTFLVLFCLVNRLQASCVRAFISWLVLQRKGTRKILQGDLQLFVTCLCLSLEPRWLNSLSFQLSCGATLGLAISSSFDFKGFFPQKLSSTFFCAAVTSPLILCVQPCLSWLVIPANTFAMPLFEGILMPISIFNACVGHFLEPIRKVTELLFTWVFALSDYMAQFEKPLLCLDERRLANWGIIYLFFVYVAWRLFLPLFFRLRFWMNQKDPLRTSPKWSSGA